MVFMIPQKCGFKIVNNNFTVHTFTLLNSIVNERQQLCLVRAHVACEQQTHFRSSLLSLRKIAIFRRERSDDRKCVCGSQANKPINRRCFTCESAHCYKVYCRILRNACCRHNHAFTPILDGAGGAGGAGRPEFPPSFPKK